MPEPWKNPFVWQEVEKFITTIDQAHQADLEILRKQAGTICGLFEKLSVVMNDLCFLTCPNCQDICCMRATIWYDFKDLLYLYFALGKLPDRQITKVSLDGQTTGCCCHFTPTGCNLSRFERPFVCTWYLCPNQKKVLSSTHHRAGEINKMLDEIKVLRAQMESAFCQISAGGHSPCL